MSDLATPPMEEGNVALLNAAAAAAADPDMFRHYFLGALAAGLSDQPQVWAQAIEVAQFCDRRADAATRQHDQITNHEGAQPHAH